MFFVWLLIGFVSTEIWPSALAFRISQKAWRWACRSGVLGSQHGKPFGKEKHVYRHCVRNNTESPYFKFEQCSWLLLLPVRYGQLSGMVEPIAGLLGAFAVVLAEPLLPYALAFAAGAMVYVVVDDIIPEAQVRWEGKEDIKVDLMRFCVLARWKTFCFFLTNVPFLPSNSVSTSGNGKLASWTSILGFVVMMSLDVGLG